MFDININNNFNFNFNFIFTRKPKHLRDIENDIYEIIKSRALIYNSEIYRDNIVISDDVFIRETSINKLYKIMKKDLGDNYMNYILNSKNINSLNEIGTINFIDILKDRNIINANIYHKSKMNNKNYYKIIK